MKTTGKILRVEYGYGMNREGNYLYGIHMESSGENVWGVTLWLKAEGHGVFTDFIGVTLSDYPTNETAFEFATGKAITKISSTLDKANKRLISELVGLSIEIEHENEKLISWSVK